MVMDYTGLLSTIVDLNEREWIEVKHNNCEPAMIGEYISAVSNAALLHGRTVGYIAWGLENATVKIVGTMFRPRAQKIGNEELENWLTQRLSPKVDFRIHEFEVGGRNIVIFEVPAPQSSPLLWEGVGYIRVGTYKKKLSGYPEKERALWANLSGQSFESGISLHNVTSDDVLKLIDYQVYFELSNQPLPSDRGGILKRLESQEFIVTNDDVTFNITNLGAILLAKDLNNFGKLARKAVRVVIYKGKSRTQTIRERAPQWGYAAIFARLIAYVNDNLPSGEVIGTALREEVKAYPEIAIRELIANALIHQDFSMAGVSPMVEIFDDRIEITNPGVPLIDTLRFMDEPPRSRNEKLAGVMRLCNICEERGSGIDKTIFEIELYQLPPPDFISSSAHTKVILFAPRPFAKMDKKERIRACYWHACLQYVSNDAMTNTSLRKRLGIPVTNYPAASVIIGDTLTAHLIKQQDPENISKKHSRYVRVWA